jgi:hypothetical protein
MKCFVKISSVLFFIILTGCHQVSQKRTAQKEADSTISVSVTNEPVNEIERADLYDSLEHAKVDTTTLSGEREYLMNRFLIEHSPSESDYDTLRDLNFDGFKDYIIGYYAMSGTGIKNRVAVYFYNKKQNRYILNEELSDLPNPTFYIDKKKITGFYIGNGGGGGGRLEWINGKWITTKEFEVHNEDSATIWKINYPVLKKKVQIIRPFQMIPPEDILETNIPTL